MCGRYVLTTSPEALRALFRYREEDRFPARYNIAPTQPIPVVRWVKGEPSFALMRWGLIPAWVKDPRGFSLLVNARGESVCDKPAFRNAMKRRRCLVPADGFYEWKDEGGRKRPYFVRKTGGGPLAFAGLWETWCGPDGEEMDTVCIVTTAANRLLAPIHDRMPVIIAPEAFDFWLDCDRVDALTAAALIAPAPEGLLEACEVSRAVNRAANDSPALIEPLSAGQESGAGGAAANMHLGGNPRIAGRAPPSRVVRTDAFASAPARRVSGADAPKTAGGGSRESADATPEKDDGQASLF